MSNPFYSDAVLKENAEADLVEHLKKCSDTGKTFNLNGYKFNIKNTTPIGNNWTLINITEDKSPILLNNDNKNEYINSFGNNICNIIQDRLKQITDKKYPIFYNKLKFNLDHIKFAEIDPNNNIFELYLDYDLVLDKRFSDPFIQKTKVQELKVKERNTCNKVAEIFYQLFNTSTVLINGISENNKYNNDKSTYDMIILTIMEWNYTFIIYDRSSILNYRKNLYIKIETFINNKYDIRDFISEYQSHDEYNHDVILKIFDSLNIK